MAAQARRMAIRCTGYTLRWADTLLKVQIESDGTRFRAGEGTTYLLDGVPVSGEAPRPMDGGTRRMAIRWTMYTGFARVFAFA